MQIFNKTTIVGLFGSDQEVEKAVAQLQEHNLDKGRDNALQIIDDNRLNQEMPTQAAGRKAVSQPGTGVAAGGPAVLFTPAKEVGTEKNNIERSAYQFLTGEGLGNEEASFYARHLARGNKLVILKTSEDKASKASEIMRAAGARTLEA